MTLLFIALGATFSIVWLLTYLPICITICGKKISPRLIVCKFIAPFDSVITIILICGSWIGITSVVGIGLTTYNVLTGIGLSIGAALVRKVLAPKWKEQFEKKKEESNV